MNAGSARWTPLVCAALMYALPAHGQTPPPDASSPASEAQTDETSAPSEEAAQDVPSPSIEAQAQEQAQGSDETQGEDEAKTPREDEQAAAEEVTSRRDPEAGLPSRSAPSSDVAIGWNTELDQLTQRYRWSLDVGGYLRVGYLSIQDDPSGTFGLHDGFVLANARLSLLGRMRSLGFKFQLDGAVDRQVDANDPNSEIVTRLKDAYIFWEPVRFARLSVGQFKAPFDIEEVASTASLLFVERSVGSRGVRQVEGLNVEGLSIQREVGAMLSADPIFPFADGDEADGPGVSYALAVTNGATANRALNDNDRLAGYGRLALHWDEYVSVGGAYFLNDRTLGETPDLINQTVNGWTADLSVDVAGLTAIASVIGQAKEQTELTGIEPDQQSLAYQAQIAYREPFLGFQPAFRYAFYDPTHDPGEAANPVFENDALTYYTIGLNYVPDYPVRLMLNYTLTSEQQARALRNNRFDALLQVVW